MLEFHCFKQGTCDQPDATNLTDTMHPPALFVCATFPNWVSVTAATANKIQSLALANMWYSSRAVGTFRQLVTKESSELHVLGTSFEAVQGALASVTVEALQPYVDVIERARCEAQTKVKAGEVLKSMRLEDFGRLVCSRSGAKLKPFTGALRHRFHRPGTATFQFQSVALLPVTHFKALARLTEYQSSDRAFAYSETWGADLTTREKLLSLADKIARSTKKVTKEDIAARRASRNTWRDMPTQEEIEEHIIDFFGYGEDKPEHIAAAIKALTGR